MRRAGQVVAEMHEATQGVIRPGVTTAELDRIAREVLAKRGARSNFLGYGGDYPAVICASPNSVVVHGIPDDVPLEEGDIISVDCGAIVDGYHGDAAYTAPVGEVTADAQRLIDVTRASLDAGIQTLGPGSRLGDLGFAVQSVIEGAGYSVAEGLVGHGIGTEMHEPPNVPNEGSPGKGLRVGVGDVFAVEPMACMGTGATILDADGWTMSTADGRLAAHWEHTVAVTDNGWEVLTIP